VKRKRLPVNVRIFDVSRMCGMRMKILHFFILNSFAHQKFAYSHPAHARHIKTMKQGLKIAIGGDHAGFEYKQELITALAGNEVKDFGPFSEASCDYPDFAHPVALAVGSGSYDVGILICGSGNGVAMTANKHQHVRAAICWNEELAERARSHNDANILCLPARHIPFDLAQKIVEIFLETEFEGGRHANRVGKITC
jgi:ribose 5-phosphate isomerase B